MYYILRNPVAAPKLCKYGLPTKSIRTAQAISPLERHYRGALTKTCPTPSLVGPANAIFEGQLPLQMALALNSPGVPLNSKVPLQTKILLFMESIKCTSLKVRSLGGLFWDCHLGIWEDYVHLEFLGWGSPLFPPNFSLNKPLDHCVGGAAWRGCGANALSSGRSRNNGVVRAC